MRKSLFLLFILALSATLSAQWASVVGSHHDLSTGGTATAALRATNTTWVCDFCHTPHQAVAANKQYPLWNHTPTATAVFGTYTSATMNSTPVEIGGGTMGSLSVSLLCMSCHDGTIGLGSLYKQPYLTAGVAVTNAATTLPNTNAAYIGTDLTDDHPVNMVYNAALVTADGGLNDPTVAPVAPLLINTRVQCSSCHDVHNPFYGKFLVMNNAASALCTTCHHK